MQCLHSWLKKKNKHLTKTMRQTNFVVNFVHF